MDALRLKKRAFRARSIGTRVPVEPQPPKVFQYEAGGFRPAASPVDVLDPKQKPAAARACVKPGKQAGARDPQVESPRGTRGQSAYVRHPIN